MGEGFKATGVQQQSHGKLHSRPTFMNQSSIMSHAVWRYHVHVISALIQRELRDQFAYQPLSALLRILVLE